MYYEVTYSDLIIASHQSKQCDKNFFTTGFYKLTVTNSSGRAEKEVIVSVVCDGGDGGEGGGSEETNRPVPLSEFGVYVAQHHVQGNKMFTQVYQVKWRLYE